MPLMERMATAEEIRKFHLEVDDVVITKDSEEGVTSLCRHWSWRLPVIESFGFRDSEKTEGVAIERASNWRAS